MSHYVSKNYAEVITYPYYFRWQSKALCSTETKVVRNLAKEAIEANTVSFIMALKTISNTSPVHDIAKINHGTVQMQYCRYEDLLAALMTYRLRWLHWLIFFFMSKVLFATIRNIKQYSLIF